MKILQDFISSDYSTDRNEVDDSKLIIEDIERKADLRVYPLDERDEGAPPSEEIDIMEFSDSKDI